MKTKAISTFFAFILFSSIGLASNQMGCFSNNGLGDDVCRNFSYSMEVCSMAPVQYGCQWGSRDTSSDQCRNFCDSKKGTPQGRQSCSMYNDSAYSCVENSPELFECYWAVDCQNLETAI